MLRRDAGNTPLGGGSVGASSSTRLIRARSLSWAVAGARGGTGKSLIAAHLGANLAARGWQVLLADLDWGGGNLRTLFGSEPGEYDVTDLAEGRGPDTPSALPMVRTGLRLVPGISGFFDVPTPQARMELSHLLQRMPCHHLVMDLGAGTDPEVITPFLEADFPLLVTLPDPVGVENSYRFLGGLLRQRALQTLSLIEADSRRALSALEGVRSMVELERRGAELERHAPGLVDRVRSELASRPIYLVMNKVRRLADLEVATGLEEVARRSFGCRIRTVGAIQFDERVWIALRKNSAISDWGIASRLGEEMKELVDALLQELGIPLENRTFGVARVGERAPARAGSM